MTDEQTVEHSVEHTDRETVEVPEPPVEPAHEGGDDDNERRDSGRDE